MLLFGHTGVTIGIVKACDMLGFDSSSRFNITVRKKWLRRYHQLNGTRGQIGSIDYRLVLLGSLLPDILDKLLWLFAVSDIFISGRGYAHTFLFNLVLLISGLILTRYKKSWLLVISLSSLIHLISDQMWDDAMALWWPLLGPFHRVETFGWLSNRIHALSSDPGTYIPEIIGLVILLLFGYRLLVSRNIVNFVRTGAIG